MGILEEACRLLQDEGITARRHIKLRQYTTLRIDGEAQILAESSSITQVQQCPTVCRQHRIEWFLLGNGSSVLVMGGDFQGMVTVLATNLSSIQLGRENRVRAQSGAAIKVVSAFCTVHSLSGLESACGIPGSVGGTIYMNVGAYGGETKDVLLEVVWLDENGSLHTSCAAQLELSCRRSYFSKHGDIVLGAVYTLIPGRQKAILVQMGELIQRRRERQPLDTYSAGSTFKRSRGNYASALIRGAGLVGTEVHDAQVSTKHAGFLISHGTASSQGFLELIHRVQQEVKEHSGYELECEIRSLRDKHRS